MRGRRPEPTGFFSFVFFSLLLELRSVIWRTLLFTNLMVWVGDDDRGDDVGGDDVGGDDAGDDA